MSGIKRDASDAIFSDCVRARAQTCEAQGELYGYNETACSGQLECAHIHSRRHQYTRHDPTNAVALCTGHHMWFTANPTLFAAWLLEHPMVGSSGLDILVEKLRVKHKWLKGMKPEMNKHYREQLKIIMQKRDEGVDGRIEFEGFL